MRLGNYCLILAALLVAFTTGRRHGMHGHTAAPVPRLIAHDCAGAGGDLWAMEESDFPTHCAIIERSQRYVDQE